MNSEKITKVVIKKGMEPNDKQIHEIEEASKRKIVLDEDSKELTLEQYAEMAKIAKLRKKVKTVIALRINPETLEIAKATGKGYTGFLSRLLDNAIKDPELVNKSL